MTAVHERFAGSPGGLWTISIQIRVTDQGPCSSMNPTII